MKNKKMITAFLTLFLLLACNTKDKPVAKKNDKKTIEKNESNDNSTNIEQKTVKESGLADTALYIVGKPAGKRGKWQKYGIKSGVIEYELSGINGKEIVYWDDFGAKEARYNKTSIERDGKKIENEILLLYNDSIFYTINIIEKTGTKINMEKHIDGTKSMKIFNKEMLKELGGKTKGTETIIGKVCERWELPEGVNVYLHNEIPLKLVFREVTVVAKSFRENAIVAPEKFVLPKGIKIRTPEELEKMKGK